MGDTTSKSPYGPMRRKDREIVDRAEIDAILHAGRVMRIALADNNVPFLVPAFYAYDGEAVYFHSAGRDTRSTFCSVTRRSALKSRSITT